MKKFDFIVQTLIVLVALILILTGVIAQREVPLFQLMCLQLLIGPWQYISSLITWIKNLGHPPSLYKKLIAVHLAVASLYLLITILITGYLGDGFYQVWMIVIPWLLALFYYTLSFLSVRRHHKYDSHKGSFLPHIRL